MTESGLRAVFLAERAMLLRLLAARLGGADEAEDALHDLWLKLERIPGGPVGQPAAYLYRMAANHAADRRRSAARRLARDADWAGVQPGEQDQPHLERALIARERLRHVEAALAAMPTRMADAFRMFRFEGVPRKRIADHLGIGVSGVEKLLERAYRHIHDSGRAAGVDHPGRRRLTDGKEAP